MSNYFLKTKASLLTILLKKFYGVTCIFGVAYIRRGLSSEGNLRFKIDWASLIVVRKFTVFALFYFVLEGNFSSTSPRGAYTWRGDLTEGFLRYRFGGHIFGGKREFGVAYTWRGLFSEF